MTVTSVETWFRLSWIKLVNNFTYLCLCLYVFLVFILKRKEIQVFYWYDVTSNSFLQFYVILIPNSTQLLLSLVSEALQNRLFIWLYRVHKLQFSIWKMIFHISYSIFFLFFFYQSILLVFYIIQNTISNQVWYILTKSHPTSNPNPLHHYNFAIWHIKT